MYTVLKTLALIITPIVACQANAADAAVVEPNMFGQVIMMVVFGAIFYFIIWRPQSKRASEQQSMLSKLSVGDEIIVAGILGKISKIKDSFAWVTIAQGTEIIVQKNAIADVMPKGTIKTID